MKLQRIVFGISALLTLFCGSVGIIVSIVLGSNYMGRFAPFAIFIDLGLGVLCAIFADYLEKKIDKFDNDKLEKERIASMSDIEFPWLEKKK